MTTISSKRVQVKANSKDVCTFLSDMNNIKELLPSEKVENWESDIDTCSFTIKGLAGIGMKKVDSDDTGLVKIASHGKNPFEFTIDIRVDSTDDSSSEAQLEFNGKLNMMLEMMAKTPLTNLFNIMADKLVEQYN